MVVILQMRMSFCFKSYPNIVFMVTTVQVPVQDNEFDCGCFMLTYIQKFLELVTTDSVSCLRDITKRVSVSMLMGKHPLAQRRELQFKGALTCSKLPFIGAIAGSLVWASYTTNMQSSPS